MRYHYGSGPKSTFLAAEKAPWTADHTKYIPGTKVLPEALFSHLYYTYEVSSTAAVVACRRVLLSYPATAVVLAVLFSLCPLSLAFGVRSLGGALSLPQQ